MLSGQCAVKCPHSYWLHHYTTVNIHLGDRRKKAPLVSQINHIKIITSSILLATTCVMLQTRRKYIQDEGMYVCGGKVVTGWSLKGILS